MDEALPEWITTEFVTQCLQQEDGKEDVMVTKLTGRPVVPAGNNYGSCLVRVEVQYKDNKTDSQLRYLSVIIKSEISDGPMKDLFEIVEPTFYHEFLEVASKFLEPTFAPKSYFSPKSSVVVLEDLKERGFVMADRRKQLDFEHCRLYVNAAASMHALSVAVKKEQPELVGAIGREKLFSNDVKPKKAFIRMVKYGLRYLADVVEGMDDFSKYSNLIRDLSESLWDMLVEVHKPIQGLNTINQGDPWTTNMMFRYDENGLVEEVKLLDFQALRYGSPINDLVFFCWASGNHDVRRHHLDDLYELYLDSLNGKLEEIGCEERLSYQSLMDNVKRLSPLALFMVGTFIALFSDPDPVDFTVFFSDDNEFLERENPFQKCYTDKYRNEDLPRLLEDLELTGVFDYLEKTRTENKLN